MNNIKLTLILVVLSLVNVLFVYNNSSYWFLPARTEILQVTPVSALEKIEKSISFPSTWNSTRKPQNLFNYGGNETCSKTDCLYFESKTFVEPIDELRWVGTEGDRLFGHMYITESAQILDDKTPLDLNTDNFKDYLSVSLPPYPSKECGAYWVRDEIETVILNKNIFYLSRTYPPCDYEIVESITNETYYLLLPNMKVLVVDTTFDKELPLSNANINLLREALRKLNIN